MSKIINHCPSCGSNLKISSLKCSDCGLELKNDFEFSLFDTLNDEQLNFLKTFLKYKGNLKMLQSELQISYPLAKKKLSELLFALNIRDEDTEKNYAEEHDMKNWKIDNNSTIPSELIRNKLIKNNGHTVVHSINENDYIINAASDGISFYCSELPITPPYTYKVFDVIIDLLIKQGGSAKKGCGRNAKLGEKNCEEDTVVGAIAANYFGKKYGESTVDPVFVLASVLEWSGIIQNKRGYIELTPEYKNKINL